MLERVLSRTDYVGSDEFSIADMAIYPWIANLTNRHREAYPFLAGDAPDHPRLAAWFARGAALPAVVKAEASFAAIRSTLAEATYDERDRVFGRNAYARAR